MRTHSNELSTSVLAANYALRELVGNLPCGQQHPAKNLEGDTVVSILNTIHEIITDSPENARALVQCQAVQKLVAINKSRYNNLFCFFYLFFIVSLDMIMFWVQVDFPHLSWHLAIVKTDG